MAKEEAVLIRPQTGVGGSMSITLPGLGEEVFDVNEWRMETCSDHPEFGRLTALVRRRGDQQAAGVE